jgi:hypothetical protein
MATVLVAGDILRVVVSCYYGTQKQAGQFRLHYRVESSGGFDVENLPGFIRSHLRTPMRAWLSSNCAFEGVSVKRLDPIVTPVFYSVVPVNGTGGTAGTLPSQASGLVRFRCSGNNLVVPSVAPGVGRSYVPFVNPNNFDSDLNALTPNGKAKLNAIAVKLGNFMVLGGGLILQLGLYRPATKVFREATQTQVSELVATQRRRSAFNQLNKSFGGG